MDVFSPREACPYRNDGHLPARLPHLVKSNHAASFSIFLFSLTADRNHCNVIIPSLQGHLIQAFFAGISDQFHLVFLSEPDDISVHRFKLVPASDAKGSQISAGRAYCIINIQILSSICKKAVIVLVTPI